jgi:hypothetical protein
MADKTVTVITSGGGDYTTLNAAFSGEDGAAFDAFTGLLYINCSGATADGVADPGTGFAGLSSTHYPIVSGNNTTGKYDTSKYRIESSAAYANGIQIQNPFRIDFNNIQIKVTGTEGRGIAIVNDYASTVSISSCIIYAVSFCLRMWSWESQATTYTAKNSIFISTGAEFATVTGITTFNCYNCDCINTSSSPGFWVQNGTWTLKNCYASSNGGSAYSGSPTLTTCASADTTGTAGLQSIAYSTSSGAYFTNVTAGSEDFHIGASSALINVGTDLSVTFTTDIDGTTRPTGAGTWDIGADEIVAAVASIVPLLLNQYRARRQ